MLTSLPEERILPSYNTFALPMRGRTIKIFVILAITSICGIVLVQVYWFKKAFDKTEEEFNKNLNIALNETVKGVLQYNNTPNLPPDPVKQVEKNYFAVMVNDRINADVLEYYLKTEFNRFNITQGFEYRIFDCAHEHMVYGGFVGGDDKGSMEGMRTRSLPVLDEDNYYFTVYFPYKTAGLVSGMSLWLFSSGVLLLVVVFFAYSLFVILKQKRFSEVQRDFINNMTHEIKTPVAIISASAETLKDPRMPSTPLRLVNYATIILDEANRLQMQVERVLSLAGRETMIRLNREYLDVQELLKEVVDNILANTEHKKIRVVFRLEATQSMVYADRFYLSNLFSNLLDNAIKYSGEELELMISSENKGRTISLNFSDNGIGISREHQKRIFDKFYRVPTGNVHNVKGFGIGLNYVQLIARLHKGSVKVWSGPGKGSSFIVTLPVRNNL